jgi:hypothetical protein
MLIVMNAPQVSQASVLDDEKPARIYSKNYVTRYGKKKMSFFCEQATLNRLKAQAVENNRTTASTLRDAIQLYLHVCEEQKKQQQAQ